MSSQTKQYCDVMLLIVTRDPRPALLAGRHMPALHRRAGLGRPWRSLVLQSAISSPADNIVSSELYRQPLSIQLAVSRGSSLVRTVTRGSRHSLVTRRTVTSPGPPGSVMLLGKKSETLTSSTQHSHSTFKISTCHYGPRQ